jgi:hypothetical protein
LSTEKRGPELGSFDKLTEKIKNKIMNWDGFQGFVFSAEKRQKNSRNLFI